MDEGHTKSKLGKESMCSYRGNSHGKGENSHLIRKCGGGGGGGTVGGVHTSVPNDSIRPGGESCCCWWWW